MNFNSQAYSYANTVVENRRTAALTEFDEHLNFVGRKVPEAKRIFNELNEIQSRLLKAVFSGGENLDALKAKQQSLSADLKKTLALHDFPEDYLEIKYTCNKCGDTGIFGGETCSCVKGVVAEYNFNALCSNSLIENCAFDNFSLSYYPEAEDERGISPKKKMSEVFEYCKNYADTFPDNSKSVLMMGKTGLGKTHLSLAIAAKAAKAGFDVIYGSAQNLLRKAEKEYFTMGSDTEVLNSLLNCDLLVLDDLGTELETKFNTSQVYNIINTRLNFSKPTIISTNLSAKELEERYAQRVLSRLIGEYDCLMFVGNDVRQLKK